LSYARLGARQGVRRSPPITDASALRFRWPRDPSLLARLLVQRVSPFAPAVFLEFEAIRAPGLFGRSVVAVAARRAFEPNIFAHRPAPGPEFRSGVAQSPRWRAPASWVDCGPHRNVGFHRGRRRGSEQVTEGSWLRRLRPRSCPPHGWRIGGFPPWRLAFVAPPSS